MRSFLVLLVITVAYARADVSGIGGYDYNGGSIGGLGGGGGISQTPIVNKHFYLHAAPEERDSGEYKRVTIGRPQKNYRVVFIKTPAAPVPRISAELAPHEEKTVVYVLSQKAHEFNPNDIVTPPPTNPSKPEVYFIRYRTKEEAESAQRQIQAQYDALGGSSQVTNEGVSPISSVVGSLGGGGSIGGSGLGAQGSLGGSGGGAYLPPSIFRRRI